MTAEGAAVALACQTLDLAPTKPDVTADELAALAPSGSDARVYQAGGWLVGYLLDVFGPQAFMTLYASLAHDANTADMDAAFKRHLGRGLGDVWSAALAEDQARNTCAWACSRPTVPFDGTAIDTSGICGVPRALR